MPIDKLTFALGVSLLTAGTSAYQAVEAKDTAKDEASKQEGLIREKQQQALNKRKALIDKQRQQLVGGSTSQDFKINKTSTVGLLDSSNTEVLG